MYRCPRCGRVGSLKAHQGHIEFSEVATAFPYQRGVYCMSCWSDILASLVMAHLLPAQVVPEQEREGG